MNERDTPPSVFMISNQSLLFWWVWWGADWNPGPCPMLGPFIGALDRGDTGAWDG